MPVHDVGSYCSYVQSSRPCVMRARMGSGSKDKASQKARAEHRRTDPQRVGYELREYVPEKETGRDGRRDDSAASHEQTERIQNGTASSRSARGIGRRKTLAASRSRASISAITASVRSSMAARTSAGCSSA